MSPQKPSPEMRLRDLALDVPGAAAVLERRHLDYCCRGSLSLELACVAEGCDVAEVVRELEQAARVGRSPREEWSGRRIGEVVARIEEHHAFERAELARLVPLLDEVAGCHAVQPPGAKPAPKACGGRPVPELAQVRRALQALAADLDSHLQMEETMVLPFALELEQAHGPLAPVAEAPPADVEARMRAMHMDHDDLAELLRDLRDATGNYAPPAGACPSLRALYAGLAALDTDLVRHVHLENHVLFPKVLALAGRG